MRIAKTLLVGGLLWAGTGCNTGNDPKPQPAQDKPAVQEKPATQYQPTVRGEPVVPGVPAAQTKPAAQGKMAAGGEGKAKAEYQELKQGDRIYVVGTKAAAERVQGGGKPAQYKSAFGYGPNKETVVFEENKDGVMADHLMGEWEKRHGKAGM